MFATDLYSDVVNHCQRLWQAEWDGCVSNKLHSVKPLLGYSNLSSLSRQDAVVLRRLRIGHTRLTHSYLLNRQDQPECSRCDCTLKPCPRDTVAEKCDCRRKRRDNGDSLTFLRQCGQALTV